MLYLGAGVSAGLNQSHSALDILAHAQLPPLHKAAELAEAMGLSLSELRFLAFERRVSRISHYQRFALPKKPGGERIISAPMPRLKRAQYWILDNVLARTSLHGAAHCFVPARSIVSNALPRVGQAVVVNLDLKDFFPSIGMPRIKGVFRTLGIVVHRQPSLERTTLRRCRAVLLQVEQHGPAGKRWNGNDNVLSALQGYANFIRMVDPAKGLPLVMRVREARAKWIDGETAQRPTAAKEAAINFRALAASGQASRDGWWQPAGPASPVQE